jgi:hypothetical protein
MPIEKQTCARNPRPRRGGGPSRRICGDAAAHARVQTG